MPAVRNVRASWASCRKPYKHQTPRGTTSTKNQLLVASSEALFSDVEDVDVQRTRVKSKAKRVKKSRSTGNSVTWTPFLLVVLKNAQTIGINHALETTRESYAETLILNDPNLVKRAPNSFICFRSALSRALELESSAPRSECDLSRKAGDLWRDMSVRDQEPYIQLADQLAVEHKQIFPKYAYRPSPPGGGGGTPRRRQSKSKPSTKRRKSLSASQKKRAKSEVSSSDISAPSSPRAFFTRSTDGDTAADSPSVVRSSFETPECEEKLVEDAERTPDFTFLDSDEDDLPLDLINFPTSNVAEDDASTASDSTLATVLLLFQDGNITYAQESVMLPGDTVFSDLIVPFGSAPFECPPNCTFPHYHTRPLPMLSFGPPVIADTPWHEHMHYRDIETPAFSPIPCTTNDIDDILRCASKFSYNTTSQGPEEIEEALRLSTDGSEDENEWMQYCNV